MTDITADPNGVSVVVKELEAELAKRDARDMVECLHGETITHLQTRIATLIAEIEAIAQGECINPHCGYVPRILQVRAALGGAGGE